VADLPVSRPPSEPVGLRRRIAQDIGGALDTELSDPADGDLVELNVSTCPAPPAVADRLGLRAGDRVIARHRLRFIDASPSMSSDSYVPAALVADSPLGMSAPLRDGVVHLLAGLGHPVSRVADEIGVRMPSPGEAQELQIATGVPVLSVQRTGGCPECRGTLVSVLRAVVHRRGQAVAACGTSAGAGW
jgi:GntR family transcriptional regulator